MTEDAEYIWKVTWEEQYKFGWKKEVKAFTNKREALIFACEKENSRYARNVKFEKWFGD